MRSSSPEATPTLEDRIRERAREFDAPALVALLRRAYPDLPIRFASNATKATRGTMVDSVAFARSPDHVLVTLNLGLGAATTPLPSYFLEILADAHTGPALSGILAILDDRLLRDRVDAIAARESPRLLPERAALTQAALTLARPASPITAHWIFEAVYPELGVTVRRAPVRRGIAAEELRLGFASLGRAVFGDEAEVMIPGLEVVLSSEETATHGGTPWIDEALQRLRHRIFPALLCTDAHLRVLLVDQQSEGPYLTLDRPSQLGFDPLESARAPRVTLLFEGRVPAKPPRKVVPEKPDMPR